jgi:hypothetical protein
MNIFYTSTKFLQTTVRTANIRLVLTLVIIILQTTGG